jgi:hypothetical protein
MTTQHSGPTSFAGRPTVLIFDVNETLIDFESISPLFERVFGDKRVMLERLGHLIMYSMTITLSGLYKNYWSLGGGPVSDGGSDPQGEGHPVRRRGLAKGDENYAST